MTNGPERFDAIVVGARCAGSSTAMLLARRGHKVLLFDRDEFPSDRRMSTHMVWHGGVATLSRWGLLEELKATNCQRMKKFNLDLGEFVLSGYAPPAGDVDEAYAPRRYAIDGVLGRAALSAGVDLRPQCVLDELIFEGDGVVGVFYTAADGTRHEVRAPIVIGADGTNSLVARSVKASSYNEHPRLQGTVWAYFSGLPIDDMEFYSRPGRMIFAWRTNDDLTCFGICYRYEDYLETAQNPEKGVLSTLDELAPSVAERVRSATRESNWLVGTTKGICRTPVGPGWALVGDAGVTMDPITAAGISNALRDAELLAERVHRGLSGETTLDKALADLEEARNAVSLPLFGFTEEMAKLDPPTQDVIELFEALAGKPKDADAYFGVFAQTVPVAEFFAPVNISRIVASV
jgi:flavin-dependent dehydrogenase